MRFFFPFITTLCLLLASAVNAKTKTEWSLTPPSISLTHIFEGEINKRGKPTGLHHLKDGEPIANARIKEILSKVNRVGIYTAIVQIRDKASGKWKEKFSSMFPNDYSKKKVVDVILRAYRNADLLKGRKWGGPSGEGFRIEGYLLKDGRIITAYPIYRKTAQ